MRLFHSTDLASAHSIIAGGFRPGHHLTDKRVWFRADTIHPEVAFSSDVWVAVSVPDIVGEGHRDPDADDCFAFMPHVINRYSESFELRLE